jgi:hypothetical protein
MNAPALAYQTPGPQHVALAALRPVNIPGTPSNVVSFRLAENTPLGKAGEVIQLTVTPADVTVQTEELDTYLGGYSPFGFGADMFSKVIPVDKEAGNRRDFSKENAFEVVDVTSGRNGAIKEVDHRSALTPYRVSEFALATFIPWATENDATQLYNIRAAAGEMISWKLALAREVRVFDHLTTLTNWNSLNRTTLTTNFKWDNGSTKNPRADLHARVKASAQQVTDIGMNPDVAFYFLSDTEVRAYMKQMLGDSAPSAEIAASAMAGATGVQTFVVPGLPPIHIVPSKKLNPSTGALDYVLGDDVILVTNQPGMPRDGNRIATHMTFRHKGRSGTGVTTNEYIPQGRGINGGTMFEMGYAEEAFFASNIAGGLIKDVLS